MTTLKKCYKKHLRKKKDNKALKHTKMKNTEKDSKISFRLSNDLKAFLSEYAKSSELSLTDLCIWILEGFEKGEDRTCSSENERIEGGKKLKEITADFEAYKLKMTEGMEVIKRKNLRL